MGYLISHMYALYEYAIMLPVSFHYSSIVVWWDRSTVLWLLALDRYQMKWISRRQNLVKKLKNYSTANYVLRYC